MPKLTRNRAVLRVRHVYGMSMEGYRRHVGLSRLYHGSIMYLSRRRLWVSIMYLSCVVHTSAPWHPSVPWYRLHKDIVGTRRYLWHRRNQSAPVGACRRRSVWTTSTHVGIVSTGRNRRAPSSNRNTLPGNVQRALCHNVVLGFV